MEVEKPGSLMPVNLCISENTPIITKEMKSAHLAQSCPNTWPFNFLFYI
jgi:hypothetical protein